MTRERSLTTAAFYYADFLGVVSEPHFRLISIFLDPKRIERVRTRLPYIMHAPVTNSVLLELDSAIKQQIGADQFTTSYRSPNELTGTYGERWSSFQGAVSEVFCEVFLKTSGELQGRALITGQELSEQAAKLSIKDISVGVDGRSFRFNGHQHGFPDGMAANMATGKAKVVTLYEYKSSASGYDSRNQRTGIKQPFTHQPCLSVMTKAIAESVGLRPENVSIPKGGELPVKLIAVQSGLSSETDNEIAQLFAGGNLIIGLPSTRNLAFLVLKIMTGKVESRANGRDYFSAISPSLAETVDSMRTYKRLHP